MNILIDTETQRGGAFLLTEAPLQTSREPDHEQPFPLTCRGEAYIYFHEIQSCLDLMVPWQSIFQLAQRLIGNIIVL